MAKIKIAVVGLAVPLLLSLSVFGRSEDRADVKDRCEQWLSSHYRHHVQREFIDLEQHDGVIVRRANYRVTYDHGRAVIGFECHYIPAQNRIVGMPDTKPFKPQQAKAEPQKGQFKAKNGFTSCPTIEPWKVLVDQMARNDFSGKWPAPQCKWISAGQPFQGVYGRVTHKGKKFVEIRLLDGSMVWVEEVQLTR